MQASIHLLKTRHSLLEALETEASNPARNLKHYSFYQFPHHIQLGVLDRRTGENACPVVPLIHAQIRTNMAGLANHLKFSKTAITLGDLSELLQIEMDFDALDIVKEKEHGRLKSIFDRFGIDKPRNCDVIQVTDSNFLVGNWWYGMSDDMAFLCRHIKYDR